MKHLKLFENFNDKVDYIVKKVGNSYRIFTLTPKMKSEGGEYEDAENVFVTGTMWKNYPTYDEAEKAISSLGGFEEDSFKEISQRMY